MPQRQQPVVSVFAIHVVVRPLAVKSPFIRPKCVDEIKALLLDAGNGNLQACQRMQRRCGGKQVGQGRAWRGKETPFRVAPRQEPVSGGVIHGHVQVPQSGDSRGRCVVEKSVSG